MIIYDMETRQGETFRQMIRLVDISGNVIDLSGKTAKAQVRVTPKATALIAEMSTSLSVAKGTITFSLSAAQTANIPVGHYAYDVCTYETVSGVVNVRYYIGGKFEVRPSVTEVV